MTEFFREILEKKGWEYFYEYVKNQSIAGWMWDEIQIDESLSIQMPKSILKSWYTLVCKIEEKNKMIDGLCQAVIKRFEQDNIGGIIIKGQSLCHYYEHPEHRSPGDIDIWLAPGIYTKEGIPQSLKKRRDELIKYVRFIMPETDICYHHAEFKQINGISIETHFTPTWLNSPVANSILQKYFSRQIINTFDKNSTTKPDSETTFNIIFLMLHTYRHLFQEGISMKQLLDYFYVLKNATEEDKNKAWEIIKILDLNRFATALMYVMQKLFNLKEAEMFCKPNVSEGEFLLKEINEKDSFANFNKRNHLLNFIKRTSRASALFLHYPSEAFWEIPWRIWHYFWRIQKGYL